MTRGKHPNVHRHPGDDTSEFIAVKQIAYNLGRAFNSRYGLLRFCTRHADSLQDPTLFVWQASPPYPHLIMDIGIAELHFLQDRSSGLSPSQNNRENLRIIIVGIVIAIHRHRGISLAITEQSCHIAIGEYRCHRRSPLAAQDSKRGSYDQPRSHFSDSGVEGTWNPVSCDIAIAEYRHISSS
jgi:hypothetical protein